MKRKDHSMAIDSDGTPLPYTPKQVKSIVFNMLEKGEILLVIAMLDGELAVQVMGPPSKRLGELLTQAAVAYNRACEGH